VPGREHSAASGASDAALAAAIASAPSGRAHEEEAELYRRFAPRVRLFALRYLRNEAAAQDLMQRVFVVTLERLRAGDVRHHDAIGSFILGTSRTIMQADRRTHAHRQVLADQFADRAETVTMRDELLDAPRLHRCLEALPSRDRTILVLTFYAEKTSGEIAAEMQLAPGAVRVARHRALAKLRDCVLARSAAEK
jgi:RNA polymerase sigma-70 factor, ECF subfamily